MAERSCRRLRTVLATPTWSVAAPTRALRWATRTGSPRMLASDSAAPAGRGGKSGSPASKLPSLRRTTK